MPETNARVNLSKALSDLRAQVGEYVTIGTQTVAFHSALPYQLDVETFLATPVVAAPDPTLASLQQRLDLYRGDFLEGFYIRNAPEFEQWQLAEREHLRTVAVQHLSTLAAHYRRHGAAAGAIATLRRLLALEPWREEVHLQLMDLLAAGGEYHAALRQYELCRQALARELDVGPGEEITRFYTSLKTNTTTVGPRASPAAGLAAATVPVHAHLAPPHNLPQPTTAFVGRAAEVQALVARLENPACRLLTLLGPGGFGKTRLALRLGELALANPSKFPDGVFFIPLDGLENGALVVPAIAAALDFTFYDQQTHENQLLAYLASKRLLLILDNAEGILNASLVDRLLGRALGIQVVVTTREALHLQQEWLHPIAGMHVDLQEDAAGAALAEHTDAVALFQHCAQRARPDFDLARDLVHVQHICRLVDGAPLAIELAAAWLKALSAAQIARELTRDLDFLANSYHNVPARHRSMRAVLEQSWHYLAEDEQRVFRRLSVFEGGFRLDAAHEVVAASSQVLAALIDKSFLHLAGDGRYRIHVLLQQLGAHKLADHPQEVAFCRARHSDHFLAVLAEHTTSLVGPDQQMSLRAIQEDLDNIRTAWLYAAEHGWLVPLRAAMPCLFRFLWMRGCYEEGERLAKQPLIAANAACTDEVQEVRIALLAYAAHFAATRGAYDQALSQVQTALAEAVRVGCPPALALCYHVIGLVQAHLGNGDCAVAHLSSAYHIYHELNDLAGIAETALLLGYTVDHVESDYATGRKLVRESLDLYQALGDRFDTANALDHLAAMAWGAGEADRAETLYQESLALAQSAGNRLVAAKAMGGLALAAWSREEWDLATSLLQQRLAEMQHLGHDNQVKQSLDLLCGVFASSERYVDAISLMNAHPEMWRTPWTALAQAGLGAVGDVMRYLSQETANMLAANQTWHISLYLLVWAMLLGSDCALNRLDSSSTKRTISHDERARLACEILSVLRSYAHLDAVSRRQSDRLLATLRNEMRVEESAIDDIDDKPPAARSVHELARETLTICLG